MPSPKTTMRGIVHEIGPIEYIGTNNDYPRQRILLYCPANRDQMTQKPLGKDEFFMLDILGNKVDGLNIHDDFKDKVVEVEVRFSGNLYQKSTDNSRGYAINCSLINMKIITEATEDFKQAAVDLAIGY